MTYGVGDDEALLLDLERKLQSRYGRRARYAAERQLGLDSPSSDYTAEEIERIRRGPLRSGSAPHEPVEPPDQLLDGVKKALRLP